MSEADPGSVKSRTQPAPQAAIFCLKDHPFQELRDQLTRFRQART
jgi:hypothetical protein